MKRRTRYTKYSHTRYVSYNGNSSACTRSSTTDCHCFLRLLASAVVSLHRTGTRACSQRCIVVYPRIWSRHILHRYFLVFVQVLFFPNQPEPTLKFYETSIQAAALQRRDSIGGWLHHLHGSISVRSEAWVMVQLSRNRLALLYSTKRMVSPNFLRSLIFYMMMDQIVRNYKERFGIHVKIQTVVTFLDIGTCTTCLRMYPLRIIHTLRRYFVQRQRRQHDTRTYNIVVLQIGTASSCCLLPQQYVCLHRTEIRVCPGFVVVYLWSCFNEAFCNCPYGYSRGICFHLSVFSFFRHVFLEPEPTLAGFV